MATSGARAGAVSSRYSTPPCRARAALPASRRPLLRQSPAAKTLALYLVVGVVYIAFGLLWQALLYSSFLGISFLFIGVWVLPRAWRRLRRADR
jgi:hypothetical protein